MGMQMDNYQETNANNWLYTGKPTIRGFNNNQFISQIFINTIIHEEGRHNLALSKGAYLISKIVFDQHPPISEGKSLQKAWDILQERF